MKMEAHVFSKDGLDNEDKDKELMESAIKLVE